MYNIYVIEKKVILNEMKIIEFVFKVFVPSSIAVLLAIICSGFMPNNAVVFVEFVFVMFWQISFFMIDYIRQTLKEVWQISARLDNIEKKLKEISKNNLEK